LIASIKGRMKLAAACLDAERRGRRASIEYAKEREQWKTKRREGGGGKEKIAKRARDSYVGESATYRAGKKIEERIAALKSEGKSDQEAELKGVEEFVIEGSILKVFFSEDAQNCVDEGIKVFGGMGYSTETLMESEWRDSRIARIYEGRNEINRLVTIGMVIKKGMKGELDLM
jgi:Acyl-CoA dehydrogenases